MNDPTMRSAIGTVLSTMRAGNVDPATLPDDGHDPTFVEQIAPLLEFLYAKYFRVTLRGVENLPSNGPALLVANHSGGLPYDGAMLIYALFRDHPAHRRVRPLVADFVFSSSWMRHVVARSGGVRASAANGERLLEGGQVVAVFPEGLKGVGKAFRERYRLRYFGRGGFVRLARRAGVPITPVAIVGAEEIHPMLGKLTSLPRRIGIPYIPITPTFPLLGPLGLLPIPTKWTIEIGRPLPMPAEGDQSRGTTTELADGVRARIDAMIADLLVARRSVLFG